jgi:hypothetical protein
MSIVISFPLFACARYWKSLRMGTITGGKEGKVRENGMMNSRFHVLKMHITVIGVSMEVLVFMPRSGAFFHLK